MSSKNQNTIIAFDGHDGSGKTSLSKELAALWTGIYVRPFGGITGRMLIESFEHKNFNLTFEIGLNAIRETENLYSNSLLVFDRHWMTVLSLLPKELRLKWSIYPPTVLCWTDLQTTKSRLVKRNEQQFDDKYHQYYIDKYPQLVGTQNLLKIDTGRNDFKSCLNQINEWKTNLKI